MQFCEVMLRNTPDKMSVPSIPEFFSGKCVLVTGATGFIGKVLLEKLIRSCEKIETIYLLLRKKHGKEPQSRIKDFINLPLFDVLRSQKPGFENKLVAVDGDVSELRLGLSENDYTTLTEKVNIVFHVAATVGFNEPLCSAIKVNTRGTKEVFDLCLKMKSLQVLLYVSTAYANCDKWHIEEIVYPQHVDWKDAIETSEKIDPAVLNILQQKYIGCLPNTYILTKNMAEHVILDNAHQLPVAIFRPSVVTSTVQEPFVGWADNFNGTVGMLLAGGTGMMRTSLSDPDVIPDYVPVDVVVKAMIITAWKTAVYRLQGPSCTVYNCTSVLRPVKVREVVNIGLRIVHEFPFYKTMWLPTSGASTTNKTSFRIHVIIENLLLAVLLDIAIKIKGHKPIMVKLLRRIYQGLVCLSHFTLHSWTFVNQNLLDLNELILPEDKERFDFDVYDICIETYYKEAVLFVRKYLVNDDIENIPKARKLMTRMYWTEKIFQTAVVAFVLWMINIPSWIQYFINTAKSF